MGKPKTKKKTTKKKIPVIEKQEKLLDELLVARYEVDLERVSRKRNMEMDKLKVKELEIEGVISILKENIENEEKLEEEKQDKKYIDQCKLDLDLNSEKLKNAQVDFNRTYVYYDGAIKYLNGRIGKEEEK